ncbi:hexosephosphate transport protein [Escherichia coli]|uniref:Hexosephosphate transport protein n=1 Tax=Escherichia coli TaxID=562 RepID=A0A3S4KP31_ECOLX|nr:hexosephosphate transport protein [Escherichia coli]
MLAFLNQVRKPTLDLPLEVRRKMWFKPFMQSYLVVFIGYLTMYLIRKNFNIAQNDMISTYGLSMTQLGMIGLGFSITYGVGKTLVSYYADGKNTKTIPAVHADPVCHLYAGLQRQYGQRLG